MGSDPNQYCQIHAMFPANVNGCPPTSPCGDYVYGNVALVYVGANGCPPSASPVSDGNCLCISGHTDSSGNCRETTNADCGSAGMPASTDPNAVFPGGSSAGGGQGVCSGGCKIQGSQSACALGSCFVSGPFSQTGQACSSSSNVPPADATATSCAKQGMGVGTVNNVATCVPATSGSTTQTSVTSSTSASGAAGGSTTSTTTVNNGDGTTTTTTTTRNSDGSQTVTSSTGKTVGSGGVPGSSGGTGSGTGTGDQPSDFCVAHPSSIICTTSTFSGSCGASFACTGDAVQCAMAQDQHTRFCQLMEPATAGGDLSTQSSKGQQAFSDGDHPSWSPSTPGNETSVTVDLSSQLDATNPFGGSCPSDQAFSLGNGQSVTIAFSQFCTSFVLVGNLILAVAYLAAAFIVFKT